MDNNILYGYADINGNLHFNNLHGFKQNYKIMSIQEILETGLGTCIEQVKLEKAFFDKIGLESKIFCSYYKEDISKMHLFVVYKFNDMWHYFEHADSSKKGIYSYENLETALEEIKLLFNLDNFKQLSFIPNNLSFEQFNDFIGEINENELKSRKI